jgi:hypothetical protein
MKQRLGARGTKKDGHNVEAFRISTGFSQE